MNILSMNIRGFGGLTKLKSLQSLFSVLNPYLIFIEEIMCDHFQGPNYFAKIKSDWEFCAIDSLGLSGGLLTGWNPLTSRCKAFVSCAGILVKSQFKGLSSKLYILNFYGPYSNREVF